MTLANVFHRLWLYSANIKPDMALRHLPGSHGLSSLLAGLLKQELGGIEPSCNVRGLCQPPMNRSFFFHRAQRQFAIERLLRVFPTGRW
jgi:hypothetical protein